MGQSLTDHVVVPVATEEDARATELGIPGVVSVVHNPEHMGIFGWTGVNTMQNPQRLIAEYLYRAVKRPTIVDYMRVGEQAELFEIDVTAEAAVADRTLQEACENGLFDDDILIVATERDGEGEPVTPRGDIRIRPGDRLTVYSGNGATSEVTDCLVSTKITPSRIRI